MSGVSVLLRTTRQGRPVAGRLALAVIAGAAASGASIGLTATAAWLISRAAQQPPVLDLMVAVTMVRFFGVSRGAFRYLERLGAHDAAFRVLARLRSHAYARLVRLAPAGLSELRSGDLLARLVDDIDGLADLWLRLLLPYLSAAVVASVAVAGIAYLAPAAGLALGISVAVAAFAVPTVAAFVARRGESETAGARGDLAAATLEVLTGAPELAVAGATETRLADLGRLDRRLATAEGRTAAGAGVSALLSTLAGGAAVWLCLVAGIAAVMAGTLEGHLLAVVVLTPIAVHEAISGLVPAAQHLPGLAAMANRVADVTSRPDPVHEPEAPETLPGGPYGLSCRGLRARYGRDLPEALAMPDFRLEAGRRLLVTGPSGSGKSTFAAVLVRFLDPSAGSVELVGTERSVELAALAGADVRTVICLCEQEPHIFDTSILENVRLARPDAGDDEVRAALAAAQLSAWIETLPQGPATLAGERGTFISAGQRQRLSLARALLSGAPLIVFDEPTEHLDEPTAAALACDLLQATAGRTVVVITHRPELMGAVDWDVRVDLAPPPPGRLDPR